MFQSNAAELLIQILHANAHFSKFEKSFMELILAYLFIIHLNFLYAIFKVI
jgi:hypothetical protein